MEHQRLGLQVWCHGLCRRWARRNRLRHVCTCVLPGIGQASGENDGQLPPPQRVTDRIGNHLPVVRMVGIQRRLSLWRQPASRTSLLEHQPDRHVCVRDMGNPGLEVGEEMVHGRLVFRGHLRSRCRHARVRILHSLGIRDPRCRHWRRLQLRHQDQVLGADR